LSVDVHDLINMPGYGNAEKQLRKAGLWRKTKEEKLEELIGRIDHCADTIKQEAEDIGYLVKDTEKAMEAAE
jgi:hypothetical protein